LGGQFAPAPGGQFAPARGGQFNPASGGQFDRFLHLMPKNEETHWFCPECETEGVISGWQKTKWDNSK